MHTGNETVLLQLALSFSQSCNEFEPVVMKLTKYRKGNVGIPGNNVELAHA